MKFLLPLLLLAIPLAAQDNDRSEARETLRFIRLAETKKQLDLTESKLLRLNEILDTFEDRRFELMKEERRLNRQIRRGVDNDAQAERVLDEMVKVRKGRVEAQVDLLQEVRGFLTPRETLEFFKFYERFIRDVQRRVRSLREDRREKNERKR